MKKNHPSFQHNLLVNLLRLSCINSIDSENLQKEIQKRDAHNAPGKPPFFLTKGLSTKMSESSGWPVWTIKPANRRSLDRVIICVHGGSYISEIMTVQWKFYMDLVRDSGATAIIPLYSLAPHGTASSVIPAMADLISNQISLFGENSVSVIGDSAGAGLAFAAIQEIINRGMKPPISLVMISPWLDVTLSDPRSLTVEDPMLNADHLIAAGKIWAGALDPSDPKPSPLFGNLHGLPEILIFTGTLDLLYPDTLRLKDRFEMEGISINVDIRPGLIHGWAGIPFLPEAQSIKKVLLERLVGINVEKSN